jgi:hypothetical protein
MVHKVREMTFLRELALSMCPLFERPKVQCLRIWKSHHEIMTDSLILMNLMDQHHLPMTFARAGSMR